MARHTRPPRAVPARPVPGQCEVEPASVPFSTGFGVFGTGWPKQPVPFPRIQVRKPDRALWSPISTVVFTPFLSNSGSEDPKYRHSAADFGERPVCGRIPRRADDRDSGRDAGMRGCERPLRQRRLGERQRTAARPYGQPPHHRRNPQPLAIPAAASAAGRAFSSSTRRGRRRPARQPLPPMAAKFALIRRLPIRRRVATPAPSAAHGRARYGREAARHRPGFAPIDFARPFPPLEFPRRRDCTTCAPGHNLVGHPARIRKGPRDYSGLWRCPVPPQAETTSPPRRSLRERPCHCCT